MLVSTAWVDQNKGSAGMQLVEANEDILLYETGHILRTPIEK